MIFLKDLLKCELYKYKISPVRYISIAIPILICIYGLYSFYIIIKNNLENGLNPWILIFGLSFKIIPLLYSIMAIYVVQDNLNRDYSNNMFDILFTYPVKRESIYLSKILMILFILSFSILIMFLIFILGINFFELIQESNKFSEYGADPLYIYTYSFIRLLIYSFVIALIQLNINTISRNPVINIIVPILLSLISSVIISGHPNFKLFPYSYIYNIPQSIDMNGNIEDVHIDIIAIVLVIMLSLIYIKQKTLFKFQKLVL